MKRLLKVRFPDGMQIQGYFHPQDTIESVSNWISCCFCDAWTFEVFTAPPKNVLFNNRVDSKSHKKTQDAPSTLEQLGLVPAAILNVDWLGQERPVSDVPGC